MTATAGECVVHHKNMHFLRDVQHVSSGSDLLSLREPTFSRTTCCSGVKRRVNVLHMTPLRYEPFQFRKLIGGTIGQGSAFLLSATEEEEYKFLCQVLHSRRHSTVTMVSTILMWTSTIGNPRLRFWFHFSSSYSGRLVVCLNVHCDMDYILFCSGVSSAVFSAWFLVHASILD